MNISLRLTLVTALLIYYIVLFYLLRKRALTLKYTLLWLISGIVMVLIVVFSELFEKLMRFIGIIEMTNGVFAVVCFVVLIILISITSIVSKMNEKMRQLVQQCAIYEKRIRELEKLVADDKSN